VVRRLVDRVDALLIGGGMANTFLLAQGHDVGRSLPSGSDSATPETCWMAP
jgi:3-phosphoglycerate kinase